VFDIIKSPLIIGLFIPLFVFFELIEIIRDGKKMEYCLEELKELSAITLFLGIAIYGVMVWEKDWL